MNTNNWPTKDLCNKVIIPCCENYGAARQIFNRSIQKFPSRIVFCQNKDDVKTAIQYAVKHDLKIRLRSGRHNYEGFCVGNNDLVIDTSQMKHRQIDEIANTVQIGSGVNNKELYHLVGSRGYPFPSGTCPTVSAAGLTQGGGWGHSARMFGLACDNLIEATLVDTKGSCITASNFEHQNLFWALRGGGGGNFGVVTSLKYKLPPRHSFVTYVDIQYPNVTPETALLFFETWQKWLAKEDIHFTPNSRIFNSEKDGMGIFLRGFYYGTPQETIESIAPFLEIPGAQPLLKQVTFLEATQIDAAPYPKTEQFRFAGRFAHYNFTKSQMESIINSVKTRAKGSTYASVALYALGGKVRYIAPKDTAFYYRNANYIIGIETVWENPCAQANNLAWLYPRFAYLQSITTGSYINFPYLGINNYMNAYYGANAKRLSTIKTQYDPFNLFCFPQSIK